MRVRVSIVSEYVKKSWQLMNTEMHGNLVIAQ